MRGRSLPFVFSLVLLGVGCGEATTPDGSTPVDVDVDVDADEDGRTEAVDCDDTDPAKGGAEVPYDGIDQDCDPGTPDDDLDQDGLVLAEDCDDNDPALGGEELPYDGVDQDCDPGTPDDDLDQDGLLLVDDCDDTDPARGGVEVPGDGVDNDCDPETSDVLEDRDGDGVADTSDRCPDDPDPGQEDEDRDGLGDACEHPMMVEAWSLEGDAEGGMLGWGIGFGDADADGLPELALAAPASYTTSAGVVSVFAGEANPLVTSAAFVIQGDMLESVGQDLAWGDFDGDGFGDLAVSSKDGVEVYRGSSVGLEAVPTVVTRGDELVAADFDADGFDELVVGAPLATAPGLLLEAGVVVVHEGSPDGLALTPSIVIYGDDHYVHYGSELAGVGDVDGDGYPELAVGVSSSTRVDVFRGSPAGMRPQRDWWVGTTRRGSYLGVTVAGGDVNGDGFSDVVVGDSGADGADPADRGIGAVVGFNGSPTGLPSVPDWSVEGVQRWAGLGGAVAVGDVDGDGFADVAAAATAFSGGQESEGALFLFLGSATGPAPGAAWTTEGEQADARLGATLVFGDSNGDGRSDLAASSAWWDSATSTNVGKVWLFQGLPR